MTTGIKLPPILRAVADLKPAKPILFAGLDDGAPVPPEQVAQRPAPVTARPLAV